MISQGSFPSGLFWSTLYHEEAKGGPQKYSAYFGFQESPPYFLTKSKTPREK